MLLRSQEMLAITGPLLKPVSAEFVIPMEVKQSPFDRMIFGGIGGFVILSQSPSPVHMRHLFLGKLHR